MTTASAILAVLLTGLSPSPSDAVTVEPAPEPIVQYVVAPHPADQCQEDEAWIAVNWKDGDAFEDIHGVSRACRSVDQLIDWAIEVAIQEGVLQYVP